MLRGIDGGDNLIVSVQELSFAIVPDVYLSITNGSLISYSGWSTTDYVPIGNGILICSNKNSSIYNCQYNEQKQFLNSFAYGGNGSDFNSTRPTYFLIMPDSTVKYVRLSDSNSIISSMHIYPIISGEIKMQ
jgi:hypothetical protein